nr:MAG TPA: hypothetical protein [Caudoviricetes sp.]
MVLSIQFFKHSLTKSLTILIKQLLIIFISFCLFSPSNHLSSRNSTKYTFSTL